MLLTEVSELRHQVFADSKTTMQFFLIHLFAWRIYKLKLSVYSCFNFLMGTLSHTTIQISIACLRLVMYLLVYL